MEIRTHNCYELTEKNVEKNVELIGWIKSFRNHGGKKFIDLRDMKGITQIVFDPKICENFDICQNFKVEYLIKIFGEVSLRPKDQENKKLNSGNIEVIVKKFEVINKSEILPFGIDDDKYEMPNEELRMEYRYLDLRRESMKNIFIRRSKFLKKIRDILEEKEFIEIDTPNLTKSTPEGARDFLVPFRKKKGEFFALPQSPQLFKQVLMCSGFEKYFQYATCFRDEDLRKDRQYEHKQLDIEMAYLTKNESFEIVKDLFTKSFDKIYNQKIEKFQILKYEDCMKDYGCDKPDLRITIDKLFDVCDIAKNCEFSVFSKNIKQGGIVKGIRLENGQKLMSRKDIDKLISYSQKEFGAKGIAWMKIIDNKIESSISKFFNEKELKEIIKISNGKDGDLLFFSCDSFEKTNSILDNVRRYLAQNYNLLEDKNHICFVEEFPLFKFEEKLDFEHNPFSMPLKKDIDYLLNLKKENIEKEKEKLLNLKSDCYDVVFNGVEISSGAQRIYLPELQEKMFELCSFSKENIEKNFGWFVKAYKFGAPPHRGFGIGIDRIIMMLEKKKSIREVIAFPRNKHGFCPLTNSPNNVDKKDLEILGLEIKKDKIFPFSSSFKVQTIQKVFLNLLFFYNFELFLIVKLFQYF